MFVFFSGIIGDSEIMYIQPLPLLQIAARQVSERLDKQQWPSDFLANELGKLPANLKDRIRTLFLKHRNLPQNAAKVNAYLPKLLHARYINLLGTFLSFTFNKALKKLFTKFLNTVIPPISRILGLRK